MNLTFWRRAENPRSEGQNHGYKRILCTCLAWFSLFVAISVQILYQKLKLRCKAHQATVCHHQYVRDEGESLPHILANGFIK